MNSNYKHLNKNIELMYVFISVYSCDDNGKDVFWFNNDDNDILLVLLLLLLLMLLLLLLLLFWLVMIFLLTLTSVIAGVSLVLTFTNSWSTLFSPYIHTVLD